jgi:hypothetical protein
MGEEQWIPSGDEIAQEFERFLRNQGDRPADPPADPSSGD